MMPAAINTTTPGCRPPLFPVCFPRHNPCFLANGALFSGLSLVSTLNIRTFPLPVRAIANSNQGNSDGSNRKKVLKSANISTFAKALFNFTLTNFLPIGLKLRGGEFRAVAEAWPAGIFGLVSILLVSPLFSRLILQVQLAPQEFVTGLAIFSCMPTTLSSGVALTQLVGGNSALALAMTVISNLLAILTVPFWISNVFADGFGASIPTGELFWSLIFTLLVPLVLGKVVRNMLKGLATYIDQNQRIFSMMSTVLLSLTPWMQVSKSRPLILMLKPKGFIEAMGMGILVHLTLLGFNAIAVKCMSAGFGGGESIFSKKENFRALLIVCSQKALLIVVAVVDQLSGVVGESGLLVLPCVVAHINQVIIDSVLVNFWLWKDLSYNKDFEA
ncbi:probable sodium/metabolite cotransporter BASS4, chloroplastic isoform X2 [Carya illinoinensis]|uniref:Probable sodium/metabolite cotransporter BASS4, chloroplastic n=1 Tax=Carya illinoinensis TaxID=32201 RepID=A0A8T1ND91_CARIL|nr:probable sodium/metabolite cotransporter BASS4, chloroplastic isoform X2 [Carya illinoinensis]KAG6629669.1 hypothetical protein CIPAW_14G101300 [Carya illinoinensis]